VSYTKARAESLGLKCDVSGLVERAERLVGVLVATGLDGLGVPYIQEVALWAIAVGSFVTVFQRMLAVRREADGLEMTRPGTVPEGGGSV
jgi:CDP-diacylglycerol--glycerol-3-phosphate 3-phosphatidyltransferase